MPKFKNFLLDITLIIQILIMIVLIFFNWTYNLNTKNIPIENSLYEFIQNISLEQKVSTSIVDNYKAVPTKIAIKNNENLHIVMYDDLELNEIYTKFDLLNILSNMKLENIEASEYNAIVNEEKFAFFEFLTPLSAIIKENSDIYVSNLIITPNTIYIKDYNNYYVSHIQTEIYEPISYNNKYYFNIDSDMPYNLISDDKTYANQIKTRSAYLDYMLELEIIKQFSYNSNLVEKYTTYNNGISQSVYIDEYSKLALSTKEIEFETNDLRGNLYASNEELTLNQMIYITVNLFNNIQNNIGSSLRAYPLEIYKQEEQTVVILGAKINNTPYFFEDYAGYFIINNSGISYAKINLCVVNALEDIISIEPSGFIINTAQNQSNLELLYIEDIAQWVFRRIRES